MRDTVVKILLAIVKPLIVAIFGVLSLIIILYSAYALYDTFYLNRQAIHSKDLMQYKPVIVEEIEDEDVPLYSQRKTLGSDYVGWLTIDGTHIDYPVMHGKDDLEYASKDPFGRASISGSIYLATDNYGDFTDLYSLLYGHHMDNGAMFGDIDNYKDPSFLESHRDGKLIVSTNDAYKLRIFAVMTTNAYDANIYTVSRQNETRFNEVKEYIRNNALYVNEEVLNKTEKILAMSTCASVDTDGRIVIFADMVPTEFEEVAEAYNIEDDATPLAPFLNKDASKWALVNLIMLIATIYLCLPIFRLTSKFGRSKNYKKMNEAIEEEYMSDSDVQKLQDNLQDDQKGQKHFTRRSIIGMVLECIVAVIAFILFIFTENMRLPMTLIDKWTIVMILLYAILWALDVWLLRLRRKTPEEEREDDIQQQNA